jgi:hypothetical protein
MQDGDALVQTSAAPSRITSDGEYVSFQTPRGTRSTYFRYKGGKFAVSDDAGQHSFATSAALIAHLESAGHALICTGQIQ